MIRGTLVDKQALLTDGQLTTFLALSQITPGPLGFYLLFVGFSIRGLIGAAIAFAALIMPSLLVLPILKLFDRGKDMAPIKGAAIGVVVSSAALMLWTAADLAVRGITSPLHVALAAASLVVLISSRVPSFAVVASAGVIGAIAR